VRSAAVDLATVCCWRFLRFKKAGSVHEVVLRAPSSFNITCIDCGDESFAQLLGIFDVFDTILLLIRWFTPVFKDHGPKRRRLGPVESSYTSLKLTNTVVAIPIDHVISTAHIVPNFSKPTPSGLFFYRNGIPLGTTLRARPWECLLTENETDD
jgi:hypothetical protein